MTTIIVYRDWRDFLMANPTRTKQHATHMGQLMRAQVNGMPAEIHQDIKTGKTTFHTPATQSKILAGNSKR